MPLTSQELQSKLWQAADILRGQIDSADYKNYIFSILFPEAVVRPVRRGGRERGVHAGSAPGKLPSPIPTSTSSSCRRTPAGPSSPARPWGWERR